MREQFVTSFMTKISDKIDDNSLKIIFKELTIFVNNFEIKKKRNSIDSLPRISTRMLSGLFRNTKN